VVPPPPVDFRLLLPLTVVELTELLFLEVEEGLAPDRFRDEDAADEAVETEDAALEARLLLLRLKLRVRMVDL
jgi:hypothetical protein